MKKNLYLLTLLLILISNNSFAALNFRVPSNKYNYCEGLTSQFVWNSVTGAASYKIYCPGVSGIYLSTPSLACTSPTLSTLIGNGLWSIQALGGDGVTVLETANLTLTVDANPNVPLINLSNSNPCVGSTVNVSTPTITGYTYVWHNGSNGNNFTTASADFSISNMQNTQSGNYVLTVTNTLTGCKNYNDTLIMCFPNPVIATAVSVNDNTPCIGTSVNFLSQTISGVTYAWSGPNGFTSTLQNPSISNIQTTASGTYSLVITNQFGCSSVSSANSSVLVFVENLPDLSSYTLLSDNTPCAGSTVNFTAPTIPGCTYSWSGPNGFTSTLQNPSIPNIQTTGTGTYSLVITNPATNCNSMSTANISVAVTVQTLPVISTAVSVDDNTPCAGSTVNFTAPTISGVTYAWSGPNGFTSTSQNPSISNIQIDLSGNYSFNIIDQSTGCSSLPFSVAVTVQTAPFITSAIIVNDNTPCTGSTVNFTAPTISGVTYAWSGPNGFTSTSQNPSISNIQTTGTGTYSLVVTNTTSGCSSVASNYSSVVVTLPVLTTYVEDGSIISDMQPITNCTYQWIDCSTNLPLTTNSQQNLSFTPTSNGNYAVIISYNECIDTSNCVAINDVGIKEVEENDLLLIYPNPSSSLFTLESKNSFTGEILNLIGEKITTIEIIPGINSIDLSNNIAGIYFIKNIDTNKVYKLIKE